MSLGTDQKVSNIMDVLDMHFLSELNGLVLEKFISLKVKHNFSEHRYICHSRLRMKKNLREFESILEKKISFVSFRTKKTFMRVVLHYI